MKKKIYLTQTLFLVLKLNAKYEHFIGSTMMMNTKIGFLLGFLAACVTAQNTEGARGGQRTRFALARNFTTICTQPQSNIDFYEVIKVK